jgi:acetyl-CoA synthetase
MLDEVNRDGSTAVVKERPDLYSPSAEVIEHAIVKDWQSMAAEALKHPQEFWAKRAEELEWYQKWHTVLDDSNKPFY